MKGVYEVTIEEELAMIYRSVNFAVNSSRSEGFGFAVAESLAWQASNLRQLWRHSTICI